MAVHPLRPERVHRFYRGGALLDRLRGVAEADTYFPEEWVGSITPAQNPGREDPQEGLSRLADGRLLRDAVEADPDYWLGAEHVRHFGRSTGLLVKLLDAAERLPVHAHPSREFAREYLGSPFGKTEAWTVLATREESAEVWVGLSLDFDALTYRSWIDHQDTEALLGSLNRLSVRAGDIVYVPAGIPHAIGPGVLIAELQEPTDFSIICEWHGFPIRPEDAHIGLGWETALTALDLGAHVPVRELPPEARRFFSADFDPPEGGRFAILLAVEGSGTIDGLSARPGDAFAVPAAAGATEIEGLRVLRCLGPESS